MKPSRITPSKPITLPIGSSACAIMLRSIVSPTLIFASIHMINPAGAATETARRSTKSTFSLTVCPIIFKNCGRLKGGSSSTKEDASPFKTVFVNTFDESNVIIMENAMNANSIAADTNVFLEKNIAITAIRRGNAPPTLWQLLWLKTVIFSSKLLLTPTQFCTTQTKSNILEKDTISNAQNSQNSREFRSHRCKYGNLDKPNRNTNIGVNYICLCSITISPHRKNDYAQKMSHQLLYSYVK